MRMGPIVLEGPDGSGKSTLAEALAVTFEQAIIKNGPPPAHMPRLPKTLTFIYKNQLRESAIIDRSWPSERIYGPRLRSKDRIGPKSDASLADQLSKKGSMILCLPPLEACLEAWRSRPDQELVKDETLLREVWAAYVQWAVGYRDAPWLRVYDRTVPGATDAAISWIRSRLKR